MLPRLFCALLALLALLAPSSAQFPRACAPNATLPNATCCPTAPGDAEGPACGGPGRGLCQWLPVPRDSQASRVSARLAVDDRLDWPLRFFQRVCVCAGNFWGYACHQCRPGWAGPDCSQRQIRVRRNVFSLSASERRLFQAVLDRAKTEPSDWVALNVTSSDNGDPISQVPLPLHFSNVSVYNFLIYVHVYAARSTLVYKTMDVCRDSEQPLDFAHRAPSFLPWHRYYLLMAEAELDAISRRYFGTKEPFALPYWDWVDAKDCAVCTNDLIGSTNRSDPLARLQSHSLFSRWHGFCDSRGADNVCHVCDPEKKEPHLWRTESTFTVFEQLPTQKQVDFALSVKSFDTAPFDHLSNASSFRNVLEGFVDEKNEKYHPSVGNVYLHNVIHSFMNGTWFDVATSPNDPLFWLHHSFVDKLFELWLRQGWFSVNDLPLTPRPGHGRFDPMVPFLPIVKVEDYVATSKSLGFDYDNEKAGTFDLQVNPLVKKQRKTIAILEVCTIAEGVAIGILIIVITTILILYCRKSDSSYASDHKYTRVSTVDEGTPLVDDSGQRKSHKRQSMDTGLPSGAEQGQVP